MSNKNLAITIAVIVLVAIGVWGAVRIRNNSKTASESQTQTEQSKVNDDANKEQSMNNQSPKTVNGCTRSFSEDTLKNAKVELANQTVTLEVKDFGTVAVELYDADAPKTVENFLRLVNAGFYDCLTFHRVAKGFVIQGGDPEGNGAGGMSAFGAEFADELNANSPSYKTGYVKGVLAMANRGPNTNSSQFFITLADLNSALPKNYTIFGKVTQGMDVVEKIGNVDINPGPFGPGDGSPKTPVVITKALIGK